MMVLAAKENLCSAQCDITTAFLHAKLLDDEYIYIYQPQSFKDNCDYIPRLKRFLYGLKQSPSYFFWYLFERLERHDLVPPLLNPCLFLSKDVIIIVYVDDLLVYQHDEALKNSSVNHMTNEE